MHDTTQWSGDDTIVMTFVTQYDAGTVSWRCTCRAPQGAKPGPRPYIFRDINEEVAGWTNDWLRWLGPERGMEEFLNHISFPWLSANMLHSDPSLCSKARHPEGEAPPSESQEARHCTILVQVAASAARTGCRS